MRIAVYIFVLSITFLKGYSQTYSTKISDTTIEDFMAWEINDTLSQSTYKKFKTLQIHSSIIPWQEALIDFMGISQIPISFENQFNQIIRQDEAYSRSSKDTNSVKLIELLNDDDISYLKLQFENSIQNANWKFEFPKSKIKKHPKNNFYSFTIPLFNESHSLAIVYKEFYCGSMCAYANLNIYKKENEIWKLYKSFGCWMS